MTIHCKTDYQGLADHLHISIDDLKRRMRCIPGFLFKQLKSNGNFFHNAQIITPDDLLEGENLSIFLTGLRNENAKSFNHIITLLNKMTDQEKQLASEVQELKANQDTLVGLVDQTLTTANATIAAHEATIVALQAKIDAGASNEDLSQIIADAQNVINSQKAEIAKLTPQPADASGTDTANAGS